MTQTSNVCTISQRIGFLLEQAILKNESNSQLTVESTTLFMYVALATSSLRMLLKNLLPSKDIVLYQTGHRYDTFSAISDVANNIIGLRLYYCIEHANTLFFVLSCLISLL